MASQNLGQVSGLWIGTSAPTNTTLIWYDSTPAIRCHKVYSVTAAAWVVLDQNVISAITYSELKNLAQSTGLTQGSWYKITDQGNILALAITSTKVQYVDVNDNFVIDDLAASATYIVTSSNLLIDDVSGVWDATNKRLKFSFAETAHDGNTDNDFVFGKKQRGGVWSLAKYKLSALISTVTGNSVTWNKGIFFNFNAALNSKTDVAGGVVGKNTYDSEKATMNQNISNVAASNQAILNTAKNYTDSKVAPSEIYGKTLPSSPTTGTAIDIAQGDTLSTIITKIQRWVNQFKVATGIKVSQSFAPATSMSAINNNDTVDSALRKIQYWYDHIELSLASTWVPMPYTEEISDVTAGDNFPDAFSKLQGKFNQIGKLSNGKIESRSVTSQSTPKPLMTLNLAQGMIELRSSDGNSVVTLSTQSSLAYRGIRIDNTSTNKSTNATESGLFSNACAETMFPASTGINHGASVVGLGYGNKEKGFVLSTDDSMVRPFIAGVAGTSNNANADPCDSYGGFFIKAKIMGLYCKCKRTSSSLSLGMDDDFITCYNTSAITITLPSSAYCGKIIKVVQCNSADVTISASSAIIHSSQNSGNVQSSINVGGLGNMATLIYDGQYWHACSSSM